MNLDLEHYNKYKLLAGVDEVGRGPLAGPVVSCCAIFSEENKDHKCTFGYLMDLGVTDSKKLTQKKRLKILDELGINLPNLVEDKVYSLRDFPSVTFAISGVSAQQIDELNILKASLLSMNKAISIHNLSTSCMTLIDGNKIPENLPTWSVPEAVVKGDSKSVAIALASIIAKEYRDLLMVNYGIQYPGYGLEKHSGYPTKSHKEAIAQIGISPIHRKTFKGVKEFI